MLDEQETDGVATEGRLCLDERMEAGWRSALGGDAGAQGGWEVVDGGEWLWEGEGVRLKGTGPEWVALHWKGWGAEAARELKNFVVEVTVSGRAEAAGVSFGPFKDFLAGVDARTGPRHLRLEVDAEAGRWAFLVDGQLMQRSWWDAAVGGVEDIFEGALRLKVRYAEEVLFQNLALRTFASSCRLSVIITCWRFLQRLRVTLRNWCHQELPPGTYEVLVVNPQSPDGTHEHLSAVARSYPHVRVREVAVGGELATDKGVMINRAFAVSRGEWVWLTDADCLFGPGAAAAALRQVEGRHKNLFYGERRFLTGTQTDALLSGRVDALRDFDELARAAYARAPEKYPWGYTQIVHRSTLARLGYREGLNHFAHSDGIFAEECKHHRITPAPLEGLFCLHMDHPFSWYGTDVFL